MIDLDIKETVNHTYPLYSKYIAYTYITTNCENTERILKLHHNNFVSTNFPNQDFENIFFLFKIDFVCTSSGTQHRE